MRELDRLQAEEQNRQATFVQETPRPKKRRGRGSKKRGPPKFGMPKKAERLSNQSTKQGPEFVFVQYLTMKQEVVFMVCKIVAGNLVVINNKVHILDPKKTWRHGRHLWYIIREIDRLPVSNEDYDAVKVRKDDTEADVPLIKAVLGAVQKHPGGILGGKKNTGMLIVAGVLIAIIIFGFIFFA